MCIRDSRMNARQTDLYIEQLLNTPAKGRHRIAMVKDVRIFVNTIDHAIRLMTDNGCLLYTSPASTPPRASCERQMCWKLSCLPCTTSRFSSS